MGNGRQPLIFFGALPLVHDMKDFIDETIQADKSRHLSGAIDCRQQCAGALFALPALESSALVFG